MGKNTKLLFEAVTRCVAQTLFFVQKDVSVIFTDVPFVGSCGTHTVVCAQGFVKELLDVADNLRRAVDAVPDDASKAQDMDVEKALSLLNSLKEGVVLTERQLFQVKLDLLVVRLPFRDLCIHSQPSAFERYHGCIENRHIA